MTPPLRDGIILVTGASSGIGRELARLLAAEARVLILVARRAERLEALASELRAQYPKLTVDVRGCDLARLEALPPLMDAVEAAHGPLDVLINNAGLGDTSLFEQSDWKKTEQMINVNVVALTWLTRRVLPGMLDRGRGGVLNVSSGFGLAFLPLFSAYVGTKQYVTGFTECLRVELHGTGVVVSQVCPGPVATEFEEVAGNPTGQKVPGFLELSAQACAAEALAAFRRGQALCVPGRAAWLLIGLGRISPRWLTRLVLSPVGTFTRRRLLAAKG